MRSRFSALLGQLSNTERCTNYKEKIPLLQQKNKYWLTDQKLPLIEDTVTAGFTFVGILYEDMFSEL